MRNLRAAQMESGERAVPREENVDKDGSVLPRERQVLLCEIRLEMALVPRPVVEEEARLRRRARVRFESKCWTRR